MTNVVGEKATVLRRSAVFVVEPHSRSIAPELTSSKRFSGVTGRYWTSRSLPTSLAISSTTISHRSSEYPIGFFFASRNANGGEFSR